MPASFKIDAHVHVFTIDMPRIDNPRHAPAYSFTHEELIKTLDANGVDRAVIAAASPWGDYNDYMLAALRAHGKRLRATAIFRRPMERFELEAMGREGFCGIRLPFIGLPKLPDITTFEYRALFRRLAELGWHVHPHVEGEDLPKILPVLEVSGVKIVVDHFGRPEPKAGITSGGFKRLLQSLDKGRTWVKVSGGYRLGPQSKDYARELLRIAGPERLVWGSDCPFVGHEGQFSYQSTIDWLVDAVPDASAREKIFGATARALFQRRVTRARRSHLHQTNVWRLRIDAPARCSLCCGHDVSRFGEDMALTGSRCRATTAGLILLALCLAPGPRAAGSAMDGKIRDLVTAYLAPAATSGPGGLAVAVYVAGRVRFFNYGHADHVDQQPITPDSLFNLASLRKVFEATLVALGTLRGEISLDDPASKYVGELHGDYICRVTIAELVTHTSALLLQTDHPPWPNDSYSRSQFFDLLNAFSPQAGEQPGRQRIYSHAGYVLLQVVLERRYGRPIHQLFESRVLKPLGMHSTYLPERGPDNRAIMPSELRQETVQVIPIRACRSARRATSRAILIFPAPARCSPRRAILQFSSPLASMEK